MKEIEARKNLVYYIMWVLQIGELKYRKVEKISFAFVVAPVKLFQNFYAHPIAVLLD